MSAVAHPFVSGPGPRLLFDALAVPRARLRVWEAFGGSPHAARAVAHTGVEIAWIDEGSLTYEIGRVRHDVHAGNVMIVPSNMDHATTFPSEMRGGALHVDCDLVAEVGDAIGNKHGPMTGKVEGGGARVATLGAIVTEEVRNGDRGALLAVDSIIEAILVAVLRPPQPSVSSSPSSASSPPNDPAIAGAIRFIEESYAESLTVDALAKCAKMSRFHFSRRFREVTGRSPYSYLQDVRLGRAAELLRSGRHGVTEAALSVGFTDPSRFARAFRAKFGATPGRWASERRATIATSLSSLSSLASLSSLSTLPRLVQ